MHVTYEDGMYCRLTSPVTTGTWIAHPSDFPGSGNLSVGLFYLALELGGFSGELLVGMLQ